MFYLFVSISIITAFALLSVYFCHKNDTSINILSGFIHKQYLKSRFKIWDDLAKNEKEKKFQKEEKANLIFWTKFHLHKIESTFFYFLAMFFKSSRDSFALFNCDKAGICSDEDYEKHLAEKKRISALSINVLFLLIIANIATGLITSFIFPNIFKTQAATLEHTSQADWESGTASSTLDLTTSAGEIKLASAINKILGDDGATTTEATGIQRNVDLVTDENDGAIVTWEDLRGGAEGKIYVQKMDSTGSAQWLDDGLGIATSSGDKKTPKIISSGSGGAIIVWEDLRNGLDDIYAQRIDSSGAILWASTTGMAVATSSDVQSNPIATTDGADGAIIAWIDSRGDGTDVYAQRIDSNGNILWGDDGLAIATSTLNQDVTDIVSDGSGGAIVVWDHTNVSGNKDIRIQRIDSNGNTLWTSGGVVIDSGANDQKQGRLLSDGSGGAIVVWNDLSDYTFYAQKVDSNSDFQWTLNNVAIASSSNDASFFGPYVTSDGSGGLITTYSTTVAEDNNVYVQKVNSSGNVSWTTGGVSLDETPAGSDDEYPRGIVSDGSGGAYVIWANEGGDVMSVQRIVSDGGIRGPANGTTIANDSDFGDIKVITGDEKIITAIGTTPSYASDKNIYTQFISSSYYSLGSWQSPTINAGSSANWSTLSSEKTLPAGTSISFETRSINTNPTVENFSLSATATASSENAPYLASGAIDGVELDVPPSNNSAWMPSGAMPQWLEIDYGEEKTISEARINFLSFSGTDYVASDFKIQTWNGSTWDDQETITGNASVNVSYVFSAPVTTQKVRVYATATPSLVVISEFETSASSPVWSAWETVTDGVINSPDAQYFQYRATLSTTDTSVTPTLSSVTLDYVSDAIPPTIQSVSPIANNQDVDISTNLTAVFSEHLATSTVTTASFTLRDSNSGVAGSVSYANQTATFNPTQDLECSHEYFATLTTTITDLAGNPMSVNYTWQFMTSCNNTNDNGSTPAPVDFTTSTAVSTTTTTNTSTTTASTTPATIATTAATTTTATIASTTPAATITIETTATTTTSQTPTQNTEPAEKNEIKKTEKTTTTKDSQNMSKEAEENLSLSKNAGEEINEAKSDQLASVIKETVHQEPSTDAMTLVDEENKKIDEATTTVLTKIKPISLAKKLIQTFELIKSSLAKSSTVETTSVGIYIGVALLTALQFAGQINSASQIPYIFINLFGFLAYRRKRHAGIVYDSKTGKPVPFAKITIFDKETGTARETKITDKYGSYFFLVPKGAYIIKVQKKGYEQLNEKKYMEAKTQYVSHYTKDKVLEFSKDALVNSSIPIQKLEESKLEKIISKPWVDHLFSSLFLLAFTFSVLMAINKPNAFNLVVVSLYLLLGTLKYANLAIPQWGLIFSQANTAEPFALIEAISSQTQKIIGRTVADEHGRYAFILDHGEYLLNAKTISGKITLDNLKVKKQRMVIGKKIKI